MVNVAYILSAGHSGSTLLDLLIGTIPGVFSTGELVHLPWQVYRDGRMCEQGQDLCTCGKTFKLCPVWSAVLDRISAERGFDVKADPMRFALRVMAPAQYRRVNPAWYRLLRQAYFSFGSAAVRKWMRVFYREEAENSWLVYDALGEVAGSKIIVDSSKDIIRYEILRDMYPDHIRPVILIRDARGVAASASKRGDPHAVSRSIKAWERTYRRALEICRRDDALVVRYEELAADPSKVREDVAHYLGLKTGPFDNCIVPSQSHLVAGNPMRFKQEIRILPDHAWRERLVSEQVKLAREANKRLFPLFGLDVEAY